MRYICEAIDHIGFKSYLSIVEEIDEAGNVELLVQPTYHKEEAYKYADRESAERATKEWAYPNLTWSIKEVE
jgi:hypothetical protein